MQYKRSTSTIGFKSRSTENEAKELASKATALDKQRRETVKEFAATSSDQLKEMQRLDGLRTRIDNYEISNLQQFNKAFTGLIDTAATELGSRYIAAKNQEGIDLHRRYEAGDEEVAAGAQGELACRSAFPCAPLAFLGDDEGGSKYRAAYFDDNFGGGRAWRHGDWVEPTAHGGLIIHGRSDATLNPGGVRIGTAEIYNAIEPLLDASPDFSDALVSAQPFVARDGDTEIDDVRVVLFVQVADAAARDALTAAAAAGEADALVELCRCDDAFAKALKTIIRERGSPRHVPAIVCRVPDVPRTNNGKKVEMACMNLLRGRPVANRGSIANAGVVDFYEALAPHLEKLLPQGGR